MKKDIKYYLPFYLGCWINIFNDVTNEYSIDRKMTPSDLNLILNYNKKVNLHLRPLSDMTEEEYSAWVSKSVGDPQNASVYFAQTEAAKTKYLLSKGFDLFGLIESGLAIDKTKL